MYLTRMKLDTGKRKTMLALTSPNLFHGTVERSFTGERQRNLWRIDRLNGESYLMLLSEQKPDLTHAVSQFGCEREDIPWETKEYGPLLQRIAAGSRWRFRLVANPTHSAKPQKDDRSRGTIYAHITPEHQRQWLMERSEKHGFSLSEEEFDVAYSQWYRFFKGNKRYVSILAVTYEGTLTVTDAELFRRLLTEGIGRGRAYGMGLMTVVR